MGLLTEGILPDTMDLEENKKVRKKIINYCWQEQRLYFKGLFVHQTRAYNGTCNPNA
jgi:hypothetical protein